MVLRRFWEPLFMGRQLLFWLVLGSLTGGLVGVVVTYFLDLLFWSIHVTAGWPLWALGLALPGGGLLTGLLIYYGAPDAAGHGTEAVIRAVHRRAGQINWKVAPIKALATITTIAAGGAAGKEGPSAQIGAAVASAVADALRFSSAQRQKIVICGIGAGFAAVFGTPVAGAILGIEVLALGDLWYEMLLPSFAAAVMAYEVAHHLGLSWVYAQAVTPIPFSVGLFARLVGLGVASGLSAYLLVLLMEGFHHGMESLKTRRRWWPPIFPMLAGVLLFIMFLAVGRAPGGLSLGLLNQALAGRTVGDFMWWWKIVFVAVTLGMGMSGGIITPLFVIGATLGSALAGPLGLPMADGAAIGMMAVTAAGANAPVAAIFMGMEIFGSRLGPDFLIAVVPAFIMIGNHSVYPSQRVRLQKSPWVPISVGVALEDTPNQPLPPPWIRRSKSVDPMDAQNPPASMI
ncbi:MAG: chloride channel protein [Thermaerobacter sp.]|nr:chloride channel protein [Thermaerobacter sp.]